MINRDIFKDDVVFGIIAGFVGNIPKEIIAWILHFLGYARYTFVHIAAGAYVPQEFIDNPVSLAAGFITDWIMVAAVGILVVYFIRFTGGGFPIIKSIFLSSFFYIILYGALMALDVTRASLLTPLPNLLLFFPHLAMGTVIGWVIKKYGRFNLI